MQKEFNPIMKVTGLICLVIIVLCILLASCATQTRCAGKFPCIVKDSVTVTTKIVESPVIIHDTAYLRSFYPNPCADMCDSLGHLKKGFSVTVPNSKGTTTTLKEDKGKLVAESSLNGISTIASVPQTTITNKAGYQVPCAKDHEHWYETMFKYVGMIATGLGALWVFKRVRK